MMAGFYYCLMLGAALVCMPFDALAQANRSSLNYSQMIATGNTYQQLRPQENRSAIEVQNNNTADNCYVFVGANVVTAGTTTTSTNVTVAGNTLTAAHASILLVPGQSWSRYFPYVPNDPVFGTCALATDSLYVVIQ